MEAALILASILALAPQSGDLAASFGFQPLEVQKIDPKAGPLETADLDGDGRRDLIAVNNHKSRIEIYYQRPDAKPGEEKAPAPGSNELPELWRFRRETISVPNEVQAVEPFDFDGPARHRGLRATDAPRRVRGDPQAAREVADRQPRQPACGERAR